MAVSASEFCFRSVM